MVEQIFSEVMFSVVKLSIYNLVFHLYARGRLYILEVSSFRGDLIMITHLQTSFPAPARRSNG